MDKAIRKFSAGFLDVCVYEAREALGRAAAQEAAVFIREAIQLWNYCGPPFHGMSLFQTTWSNAVVSIATLASVPRLAPLFDQEIDDGKRSRGINPPSPEGELDDQTNYDDER